MESVWTPSEIFGLQVSRRIPLLHAMLDLFVGEKSVLILQGDLTRFDSRGLTILFEQPGPADSHGTAADISAVGIGLGASTLRLLERTLFTRAGITSRVNHILVIQDDELVFACFDRFSEGFAWVTASVGEAWPLSLQQANIIAAFRRLSGTRERHGIADMLWPLVMAAHPKQMDDRCPPMIE